MANALYPAFKQALLNKEWDMNTDTVKVSLINTGTSYNSAHDFYNDISSGVLGTPQTITTPTITSGVFDGDNVTFTAVAAGGTVVAYVVWIDTGGASSTDPLVAWFDTDGAAAAINIPTNGSNITITFNGSGIFAL